MKFQVWYMRPEWFRNGILGGKPDPADLDATHVHLRSAVWMRQGPLAGGKPEDICSG